MTVQDKLYTADELWELQKLPEYDDKFIELVGGMVIELTPSSAIPSIIGAHMCRIIGDYVKENKIQGFVAGADGGFVLSPRNVASPDVAFITKERAPTLPDRFFASAPDLAVEVVSPTDSVKAVHRKAIRYVRYGTRLVWVIYPEDKTIDVYAPSETSDAAVQALDSSGVLDGGDVLPGFSLTVAAVFEPLEQS